MSKPLAVADFQFVNATPTNLRAPDDKAVRALIRKQAMKQASAARRQQGNYGKQNVGQYPVFHQDTVQQCSGKSPCTEGSHEEECFCVCGEEEPLRLKETGARQDYRPELDSSRPQPFLDGLLSTSRLHPGLSLQGYEATIAAYNFDVVDLSTLASLPLGRFAGETLSANPSQLTHLLRCKQWSYLSYLPSRYGYSDCLKDAVNCIIARVRQILTPADQKLKPKVLLLYGRALKSLQKALDSPAQCYEPEVLGAIEILALYEVSIPKPN
jgi:hypothetical protein